MKTEEEIGKEIIALESLPKANVNFIRGRLQGQLMALRWVLMETKEVEEGRQGKNL